MGNATTRRIRNSWRSGVLRTALLVGLAFFVPMMAAEAQSTSAALTGTVVDETGGILSGVDLVLINVSTSAQRRATSGHDGGFLLVNLLPGRYVLRASLSGFVATELRDLVLSVDDRLAVRVELALAGRGEALTVVAEPSRISAAPSVGTVIDRQFVENLPLNGRTFQSLLELTPGVVLAPTGSPGGGNTGQFSVNGQRANTNYFTVDGVSANVGIASGSSPVTTLLGQSGSGQLPALTAHGGTAGMVSVDALEEFRIQTSSYAPEFGRTPGGQVSLVTRSGTNVLHGSFFDYVRNDALDATDWFTNNRGQPKPRMRQHDFGGVLGGPVLRARLFFFGSYEGLRLEQPRSQVTSVPSLELRRSASPDIQQYLNAVPVPNGRELGNGFAEFASSWSDPTRFDATSVRLDYNLGSRLSLFGRLNYAPSYDQLRVVGYLRTAHADNASYSAGAMWIISPRILHDLRANYTTNDAPFVSEVDEFGGAVPPSHNIFAPGRNSENGSFSFGVVGGGAWIVGTGSAFQQRSLNIVESLTVVSGSHEAKFGFDLRRVAPVMSNKITGMETLTLTPASIAIGRGSLYQLFVKDPGRQVVAFDNISGYAQHHWKLTTKLTLTYGFRWEAVPPPRTIDGQDAVTLENLDNPYGGQVHLAPRRTSLWEARYANFAPRVGASHIVSDRLGRQLVLKGGFGKFYDLGFGQVASAFVVYPFYAVKRTTSPVLPLSADARVPPRLGEDPPLQLWVMDRNLELPLTWQWNLSAEQHFGPHQTLTVAYVGSEGRRLLKLDRYNIELLEWPRVPTAVNVNRNRGYSDYRALQLQFQRRLHKGLQSLVSYTFGRSRDTASSDFATNVPAERLPPELDYGYSDYDVRQSFTAALTWDLPEFAQGSLFGPAIRDWAVDMMIRARSGFPISITAQVPFPPETESVRPDVVTGQPFWIDDSNAPGGRRLNRQAFTIPAAETQGNLLRGTIRGFSARQVDLAVRRDFSLPGSTRLQLRLEMFNLFNTPNFGPPDGGITSASFGRVSNMLNRSLGGMSSLYQIGGPRSSQLAVKLLF